MTDQPIASPQQADPPAMPPHYPVPPQPGALPQYPVALGGPRCRMCGATPAIEGTVRGHQGLIILMSFRSLEGPFCRQCGIAAVRDFSADTMIQGWWGFISVFVTPVVLLLNLILRIRLDRLADPVRHPAEHPGKPLYRRPQMLGVVIVSLLATAVVVGVINYDNLPYTLKVGACVRVTELGRLSSYDVVSCDGYEDGIVTAKVHDESQCPDDSDWVIDKPGEMYCVRSR